MGKTYRKNTSPWTRHRHHVAKKKQYWVSRDQEDWYHPCVKANRYTARKVDPDRKRKKPVPHHSAVHTTGFWNTNLHVYGELRSCLWNPRKLTTDVVWMMLRVQFPITHENDYDAHRHDLGPDMPDVHTPLRTALGEWLKRSAADNKDKHTDRRRRVMVAMHKQLVRREQVGQFRGRPGKLWWEHDLGYMG